MLHRVLWVLLSYCVSCIHTLCRVNIVSVLEHCNALWFLCWCIVVWSWVNMGGLGFCSRALHRAGFAAFWPLVGVILNQPWYCMASHGDPYPKHHLLPSPLSSVLTFWQSFHLSHSRAWTSWFTICCCRSLLKLELKSGSFLELVENRQQLPLDNQFDCFPGKFLDKHLIETNTVSSFPQNFHWLDALKYPPWHRHDICH